MNKQSNDITEAELAAALNALNLSDSEAGLVLGLTEQMAAIKEKGHGALAFSIGSKPSERLQQAIQITAKAYGFKYELDMSRLH